MIFKKLLLALLFLIILIFVTPRAAYADDEFDISAQTTYQVAESGVTHVVEVISIKNKTEYVYTPSYTISLGFDDVTNLKTFNATGSIPSILKETDERKSIELNFPSRTVGVNQVNRFTISYDTKDIARDKGSILEVSIPGLAEPSNFSEYSVTLLVPQSFGSPSVIKPTHPVSNPLRFTRDQIGTSGINVIFGNEQFYKLDLTYHITNPKLVPVKTEIALPPNTAYQEVRINSINPKPADVYEDSDGNFLAVYNLDPRENLDIKATVLVKTISTPSFSSGQATTSLSSSRYWEVGDPEIKRIASTLKTPKEIYDYVVKKLSYDYEKIGDNNVRIGAKNVLNQPEFSVCLEFTDLFVTLARAAGIRARAIEGYASTTDSKLRPLSLVDDVLHSWPEYYDETSRKWIMIDPTWGNTTRGVDYFNTFDFDHITFAIKGANSTYPVPAGGYKTEAESKDVYVETIEKSEFFDKNELDVEVNFPDQVLPGLSVTGDVIITNKGNAPVYNKILQVNTGLTPNFSEYKIDKILPYGSETIRIGFNKTRVLTNSKYEVKIAIDGIVKETIINVALFPDISLIMLGGVLIIGSITTAIITYKTWSLYLSKRKK